MSSPYANLGVIAESFQFWDHHPPSIWLPSWSGTQSHILVGGGARGRNCGWWSPTATLVEWSLVTNLSYPTSFVWLTSGFRLAVGNGSQQYPVGGLYLCVYADSNATTNGIGITTGPGGKLQVWVGLHNTVGGRTKIAETSGAVLSGNGAFDYIEFHCRNNSTSTSADGYWEVRVNGTTVLSSIYDLWFNGAAGLLYGVADHNSSPLDTDILMHDLYAILGPDSVSRRFFGDTWVDFTWPVIPANVGEDAWSNHGGSDKADSLNDGETDNDGDSTYIAASSVGDRQTFEMDLPVGGYDVPRDYARWSVHFYLKAHGTSSVGSVVTRLVHGANSYSDTNVIDANNFGTGTLASYTGPGSTPAFIADLTLPGNVMWDDTTFHAARFGMELHSNTGTEVRCSMFGIQVIRPPSVGATVRPQVQMIG
jgi:hypothetical protein